MPQLAHAHSVGKMLRMEASMAGQAAMQVSRPGAGGERWRRRLAALGRGLGVAAAASVAALRDRGLHRVRLATLAPRPADQGPARRKGLRRRSGAAQTVAGSGARRRTECRRRAEPEFHCLALRCRGDSGCVPVPVGGVLHTCRGDGALPGRCTNADKFAFWELCCFAS